MEETWRWFGPDDRVTLLDARQAGATGIVTALHQLPPGAVWPLELITARQREIAAAGLRWSVVESLEVTEAMKRRGPGWQQDTANFIESLRNLAKCGIQTVAYNLMPVFSWMRTHLHEPLPNGGYTTQFHATAFAAFDLFLLDRSNAEADWSTDQQQRAERYLKALAPAEVAELQATILQGLPGGHAALSLDQLRVALEDYRGIDAAALQTNAAEFLQSVCPVADELGIRLCLHPDDPPRPLLGLPRVVSTEEDLAYLLSRYESPANALTFCTGALGVRKDNDLFRMVQRFGPRIGFAHLRSTTRETGTEIPESFFEAAHLEGDADLVRIVGALVAEQQRRRDAGDTAPLPFRADHGQELLNDRERGARAGYPAIGRMRGLAELRGVVRATEALLSARYAQPVLGRAK